MVATISLINICPSAARLAVYVVCVSVCVFVLHPHRHVLELSQRRLVHE